MLAARTASRSAWKAPAPVGSVSTSDDSSNNDSATCLHAAPSQLIRGEHVHRSAETRSFARRYVLASRPVCWAPDLQFQRRLQSARLATVGYVLWSLWLFAPTDLRRSESDGDRPSRLAAAANVGTAKQTRASRKTRVAAGGGDNGLHCADDDGRLAA